MSLLADRIEFHYHCIVMKMIRDMWASCRTCPLAPCGHKRVAPECNKRLAQHYRVPAFKE